MKSSLHNTILVISLHFYVTHPAYSQTAPPIEWQKCLGGSNSEIATSVDLTMDGGYVIGGLTSSNDSDVTGNQGTYDYWVTKINATGAIQWQKTLGGSLEDNGNSIHQTTDGGYIIGGFTYSSDGDISLNHGNTDGWVVKLDSSGVIEWEKSLGGTGSEELNYIQQTSDGGYIVGLRTNSTDGDIGNSKGFFDGWVVKLNAQGDIQWEKSYGGPNAEGIKSIKQTSDNGFILAGSSGLTGGDVTTHYGQSEAWIIKTDSLGTIEWQNSIGGTGSEEAKDIELTTDGGYILACTAQSSNNDVAVNNGGQDYWIVKLTSAGTIEWEKAFGGSADDYASSIQQTTDDGYIISGRIFSTDGDIQLSKGGSDCWVLKLNEAGEEEWQKTLGGSSYELGMGIKQAYDEGYIIAGTTGSTDGDVTNNHSSGDYWVVKLMSSSGLQHLNSLDSDVVLYPNPTHNTIHINHQQKIKFLEITDVMGSVIYNQPCEGETISIDLKSILSKGAYFIRMYDDTTTLITVQKVILH